MFRKILYPTMFEEFSLATLKSLVCLKAGGLEEVILLHIIDTEGIYMAGDSGLPVDIDQIRTGAQKELDSFRDYLQSEGIAAKTSISVGRPAERIIETAANENVSLIVAGRQKRDALGEIFSGSTTDRIIRKAAVPVLVSKYHVLVEIEGAVTEHFCTSMFRKILHPTDWSACADRARGYFPVLRKIGAREIVLVHVIEELPFEARLADYFSANLKKTNEAALNSLRKELEDEGFTVTIHLATGKPYREIRRIATAEDVSLIVMGSHGRGFVNGILWGSVSQRIVEYSEKPVLVVK